MVQCDFSFGGLILIDFAWVLDVSFHKTIRVNMLVRVGHPMLMTYQKFARFQVVVRKRTSCNVFHSKGNQPENLNSKNIPEVTWVPFSSQLHHTQKSLGIHVYTPPRVNIAPEKWWWKQLLSFWGQVTFQGRTVKIQVGIPCQYHPQAIADILNHHQTLSWSRCTY